MLPPQFLWNQREKKSKCVFYFSSFGMKNQNAVHTKMLQEVKQFSNHRSVFLKSLFTIPLNIRIATHPSYMTTFCFLIFSFVCIRCIPIDFFEFEFSLPWEWTVTLHVTYSDRNELFALDLSYLLRPKIAMHAQPDHCKVNELGVKKIYFTVLRMRIVSHIKISSVWRTTS